MATLPLVARNQTVLQFEKVKNLVKDFPLEAKIRVNKYFKYSFLAKMSRLFPILNPVLDSDTI